MALIILMDSSGLAATALCLSYVETLELPDIRNTKARMQLFRVNFTCFTNDLIVVLPALLMICLPHFRESEAGVLQTWH